MNLESIYNGRILLVDLATESVEEEELDAAQVEEDLGGAAVNLSLYKEYEKGSPVIIGTGPLTASFAPASCLGIATAASPLTGGIVHIPLTWQTAVEVKLAGFDFIVIMGEASSPRRLWLHDEMAELLGADNLVGKDVPAIVNGLRREHGDENVQVVAAGPVGQKGSRAARLSESYWASKDGAALASVMAGKNLVAIASRGLGFFEIDDKAFERAMALRAPLLKTGAQEGFKGQLEALGDNQAVGEVLKKFTHRLDACFHCPAPCNTFLMLDQDPKLMERSDLEEPGLLVTSLADLMALSDFGEQAPRILRSCVRRGIDAVYAGAVLKHEGKSAESAEAGLEEIEARAAPVSDSGLAHFFGVPAWPGAASIESRLTQSMGLFSSLVPPVLVGEGFNSIAGHLERAKEHLLRQAAGYILGICPVFMISSPALSFDLLAQTASALLGDELKPDRLAVIAGKLIKTTLEQSPPQGAIHESLLPDNLYDLRESLISSL